MTESCSTAEIMAIAIARELKDTDFAARGTASEIPGGAIRLAQRTHAPNLWYVYGGSGALNSKSTELVASTGAYRNLQGAEYRMPISEIIDAEFTGRLTVATFGGIQVDQYGNINMVGIGDYPNLKMRGPGSIGLPFMASVGRVILYMEHHTPRVFVPRVDFISGPGQGATRGDLRYRPAWAQGPVLVVTPLAILDFETLDRRMAVKSVHPGRTVEEVQAATGFDLVVPDHVPFTEGPSPEEFRILRTEIDPTGILQRLIP